MRTESTRVEKDMRRFVSCTTILALALVAWLPASKVQANEMADWRIADAIEDEFLYDEVVPLYNLDVGVTGGIATLDGTVDNLLAKKRATRIARTIKGVRSVVNDIEVKPAISKSDRALAGDVETALLTDPATESYEIDVTASDGMITLTGTVQSYQEKDLAESVAQGISGVNDVTNDITVDYKADRSDYEIQKEIEQTLKYDALVDDTLIEVKVKDGHVTLEGSVNSAAEKFEAQDDAWVAGVKGVDAAKLEVVAIGGAEKRDPLYASVTDDEIRDAINAALLYDPRVLSTNVSVEVNAGYVTLRGDVNNLKAKRAAGSDARNTAGVLHVRNRLRVDSGFDLANSTLKDRVESALQRDVITADEDITVLATNGTVRLYGTVESYYEKAQAGDVAERVLGAEVVDNNIVVRSSYDLYSYDPFIDYWDVYDYDWYEYTPPAPVVTTKADSVIKEDIESQLWWSPFVDSDQINVSVEDGVATLTGVADSATERRIATQNALEGGAVSVTNKIAVQ